ncbi:MAG: hypothetical protein ACI8WB_002962 [Phenylobacterium sp.]|jgi:hypothetical protein
MSQMNFEEYYQQYNQAKALKDKNASHHQIRKMISKIVSHFPKDNPESLVWFTMALIDDDKKWFAAKVLAKINPVPKSLLDDLVLTALKERDPSFNRWFIEPCVKTFGRELVKSRVMLFASHPQVIENDGVNKIMYWVERS